jgi:hypothetical protein
LPILATLISQDFKCISFKVEYIIHPIFKHFINFHVCILIKSYSEVGYYIDNYADINGRLGVNDDTINNNFEYTKIEINAPSKYLTEDLWIKSGAPANVSISSFIVKEWGIVLLVVLILSSVIASVLVGLFVYSGQKRNITKLIFIGLANQFSILGVFAIMSMIGMKNKNSYAEKVLVDIKKRGYYIRFMLSDIASFVSMVFFVVIILALFSGEGLNGGFQGYWFGLIFILSFVCLIIGHRLKEIKPEDSSLFVELESYGYYRKTLKQKDNRKIIFIILFSIVYLLISTVFIGLIKSLL